MQGYFSEYFLTKQNFKMNQKLNSKQNYLTSMIKMNKTQNLLNFKFLKMKTLIQLFAIGLCLFTFSTTIAQNDSTNDHWRNSGINTWTQPSRSVGIGTNAPKEILHIQGGSTHGLTFKSTGNGWGTIMLGNVQCESTQMEELPLVPVEIM